MKLVLDIIKSGEETPLKRSFHLNREGGIVGRSTNADWQLNDQQNYISNSHVYIEYQDEVYYIRDESTNGTYLKFPYKKLPKGNRIKINSTDIYILGEYEIQARFVEDDFSTDIMEQINTSDSEDTRIIPDDDFLDEPFDSLETHEINVMDIVTSAKKTTYENTVSNDEIDSETNASELNEHHISIPDASQETSEASSTISNTSLQRSINILEQKLGIEICSLDKKERDILIEEVGDIILNSLSGLKHSLYLKEKIKEDLNVLKADERETQVNPILLGESASTLLQNKQLTGMLGFSRVSDAILQSFDELDQHNIALHASSKNLMSVVIRRFSPSNLAYYFESLGALKSIFKSKRSMMWSAYEDMFKELEHEPEKGAELISKDFAREYKNTAYSVTLATEKRVKQEK